jgi:3-oxoacyl-[acyl-carrier protein] reductase
MTECAIVTGAASGIGRAIALRLAADGFAVIALDRDGDGAVAVVDEIAAQGGLAEARQVDVTDSAALARCVRAVHEPAVLVNNAGIFREIALEALTPEDFRLNYEIHTIAAFTASQAVLARMTRGGRIINMASRSHLGGRGQAHYAAAKGALVSLTRAMAIELVERGIHVNAVAPGLVATPLLSSFAPDDLKKRIARLPGKTPVQPEDIAHVVAFLADPRTRFITGQVLLVDGGQSF